MLKNSSYSSRISYEALRDGEGGLEKSLASSRLSFEPSRWSTLTGSASVSNLADNAIAEFDAWREHHPCALEHFDRFAAEAAGKLVAVFLDYDGTLTPIVSNPDAAFMTEEMRGVVRRVAELFPTAIISGRGREKVEGFVQLRELYYAGSHGMDIVGPQVSHCADGESDGVAFQAAAQYAPLMDTVFRELEEAVRDIPGSSVEHNKFCVSVHFRNCAPGDWPAVVSGVDDVAEAHPELKVTRGRKVLEVRPQVDWDKGAALAHLLEALGLSVPGSVHALYIGDDRTDEDAFRVLSERQLGAGILVSTKVKPTAAAYTLRHPDDVGAFLARLEAWGATPANLWHVRGGCKGWHVAPTRRLRHLLPHQLLAAVYGGSGGSGGADSCSGGDLAAQQAQQQASAVAQELAAALHVGDAAAAAAALVKDGYRLPAAGSNSGSGAGGGKCTAAAKLMRGPQPPLARPPPSPRQPKLAAAAQEGGASAQHTQHTQHAAAGALGGSNGLVNGWTHGCSSEAGVGPTPAAEGGSAAVAAASQQ